MEARAVTKYIGSSPRKMRLLTDLIRGMAVDKALEVLHFSTKHASRDAEKTLRSAVANLMNKDETNRHEPSSIFIKEAYVNQGPTLKRISPAPMGRAYRIRKRSCHLTIIVEITEA
jgi:large subunit ribosomal protein L22